MDIFSQIKLIDDLIRECPDITIQDYIDALSEIDGIKIPEVKSEDMRKRTYTTAQELFILENHEAFTASEISSALLLELTTVYNIGTSHRLKFKAGKVKKPLPIYNKAKRIGVYTPDRPKDKMVRPAASYDNLKSNYLNSQL